MFGFLAYSLFVHFFKSNWNGCSQDSIRCNLAILDFCLTNLLNLINHAFLICQSVKVVLNRQAGILGNDGIAILD